MNVHISTKYAIMIYINYYSCHLIFVMVQEIEHYQTINIVHVHHKRYSKYWKVAADTSICHVFYPLNIMKKRHLKLAFRQCVQNPYTKMNHFLNHEQNNPKLNHTIYLFIGSLQLIWPQFPILLTLQVTCTTRKSDQHYLAS